MCSGFPAAEHIEILDMLFQSPIRNVVHRLVAFLHRKKTCGETRLVGTFSKLTVKVARAGDIYNPVFNLIVAKTSRDFSATSLTVCCQLRFAKPSSQDHLKECS